MGTGRQQKQPGADPAPAHPVTATRGWLPLTPNGVAAYAQAPLQRVIVLQAISATVCTLVFGWLLVSSVFPTIQEAVKHLPEQGMVTLGELKIAEDAIVPHPLAASTWLALDVDATSGAARNPSRDVDIVFARNGIRLISALGTSRIPYPPHWYFPFNRVDLLAAWEAWEAMLYGALLLATFIGLIVSWWILATMHCLLPRILAYFTERDLSLNGAWKLCAASLVPGAILMIVGLIALELDALGGVQFALLFVIHFLVPIVYSLLGTCHLAPSPRKAARAHNPFGPAPSASEETGSASSSPAPRKPANPFARID